MWLLHVFYISYCSWCYVTVDQIIVRLFLYSTHDADSLTCSYDGVLAIVNVFVFMWEGFNFPFYQLKSFSYIHVWDFTCLIRCLHWCGSLLVPAGRRWAGTARRRGANGPAERVQLSSPHLHQGPLIMGHGVHNMARSQSAHVLLHPTLPTSTPDEDRIRTIWLKCFSKKWAS